MKQLFKTYNQNLYAYKFTTGNCFYDYHYTLSATDPSIFGEIKVRDFSIDQYNTYIIELQKLNNLSKLSDNGYHVQYTNFFITPQGTYDAIVFDIPKRIKMYREKGIQNFVQRLWCNKATYRSRNNKTEKLVIYLEYNPDIDVKIQNTTWRYDNKS